MALWRLYYHIVWSTKDRRDLITPDVEPNLYGYIIGKAVAFGAIVHAIDGTTNHTHIVTSVPPSLALSDFVKEIKGSSSHHINHGTIKYPLTFAWQGGYGVFSLGGKQLDDAIAYVLNQKEHHARGTLIPALEQADRDDDQPQIWRAGAGIRRFPIPDIQRDTDE